MEPLDWSAEQPRNIRAYGIDVQPDNVRFLQARRLTEAGVRCVAFEWGFWDTHGSNFEQLRRLLPALDQGLSALLDDLHDRGRLNDTLILMSGEFGRTPRINDASGRDHWHEVSMAFVAGGGLDHGRVIGQTDSMGRFPIDPVPMQSVLAIVYRAIGIDAVRATLPDRFGNRHPILGW